MKKRAYILLGTNLGDKISNLNFAVKQLSKRGNQIVSSSSIYQTKAWGDPDQPDYLNQVIEIETEESALVLLGILLEIEASAGRVREKKWGARTLDLDLLFYGTEIIDSPNLQVPHPRLHIRRFTLEPLAEIAASFIHPILNKSVDQLLQDCQDTTQVLIADTSASL